MSRTPETRPTLRPSPGTPQVVVDRIACTGHGACAALLPRQLRLDEWNYPIVVDARVDPSDGATAVRLCPARALSLRAG